MRTNKNGKMKQNASLKLLLEGVPPNKQVLVLLKYIQPKEEVCASFVAAVQDDIEKALTVAGFHNHKVIPFGSATNGLFIRGSDLDFYVHMGNNNNHMPVDVKGYLTKLTGVFKQLGAQDNKTVFQNLITLKRCRVPLLKCTHVKTGLSVDINFSSQNGVNNSCLIKHLLTLDTRIRPLFLLLKYYFKQLKLKNFTNFHLYALIIYALQNLRVPVLPPLSTFLVPNKENILVDERWNVRFDPSIRFNTKNTQTLMELVLDFCSFYVDFDFKSRIVSPYMGNRSVVTRGNFHKFEEFQCHGAQVSFSNKILIQDFYELNKMVGSQCKRFREVCLAHHNYRDEYSKLNGWALFNQFINRIK